MARQRVVTRTFKVASVKAKVFDLTTNELGEIVLQFTALPKAMEAIEKRVSKKLGENFRLLTINEVTEEEVQYSMPEEEFINTATKIIK